MTWQRDRISVAASRTFHTISGDTIPSPIVQDLDRRNPLQTNAGFFVWWQPDVAAAWFAYAKQLLDDQARIDRLNSGTPSRELNLQQLQYVYEILSAIANGFNALNIPWFLHQRSRELWWAYFAGITTNPLSIQSDRNNFNLQSIGWYTTGNEYPVLSSRVPVGIIPNLTKRLYASRDDRDNNFVQTCGLGLSYYHFDRLTDQQRDIELRNNGVDGWYYAKDLLNRPFNIANNAFWDGAMGESAFPGHAGVLAHPYNADTDLPGDGWIVRGNALADRLPTYATVPTTFIDDWRSFRGDFGVGVGARMKASLGQFHYLPWLRDWVDSLISSSPAEIVTSAREFAIYTNWLVLRGGDVLASFQSAVREAGAADTTMIAIAQSAAALGAALAGVTYGISAIIGGAVATTLTVVANQYDPNKVLHPKDDLGRFKVTADHAWLSGDASLSSSDAMPFGGENPVPAPPGFAAAVTLPSMIGLRPQINLDAMHRRSLSPNLIVQPAPPTKSQDGSGGKTSIAKPLAVGALALAAIKLLPSILGK